MLTCKGKKGRLWIGRKNNRPVMGNETGSGGVISFSKFNWIGSKELGNLTADNAVGGF